MILISLKCFVFYFACRHSFLTAPACLPAAFFSFVLERKKRICNTVMMNVSQTGWVEIDIKRAIYIWEETAKQLQQTQQNRSPVLVGWLMIEVHDEEEQPLKPGLFFKPPNCNQAGMCVVCQK